MSTKYKKSSEVPTGALADRLDELSDAVCARLKGDPKPMDNEFTCRIPAEVDRDVDLVLCEAAKRLRRIAELEAECGYSDQEHFDIAGKRCGRDFYWAAMSVIKPLQDKTSELEAERAELVKDRERLDWLTATIGSTEIAMERIASKDAIYIGASEPEGRCYEDYTLRQAIDAAREGE